MANLVTDSSLHSVLRNNDTDTTALVTLSKNRKEIVVAYCGTVNAWNVILDLELFESSYDDSSIKIHVGFYKAAMSLYNDVNQLNY